MADTWFYSHNNERKGPVDLETLKLLISSGSVSDTSLVWKKGMANWVVAATIDGLVADVPPPMPQAQSRASSIAPGSQAGAPSAEDALKRPNPNLAIILLVASSGVLAVDAFLIVIQAQIAGLLALFAVSGFISAIIFSAIFIYRAWLCVPESLRSTTPEKAVGFLFIPFFNFYWFFIGIRGLSADTERTLKSKGIDGSAPVMLSLITAILLVATAVFCWVPFLCHIVFGACVVVFGLWMIQQAQATACLVGAVAESKASANPWLLKLYGCAAMFTLLMLIDDVQAQKADAARARVRARDNYAGARDSSSGDSEWDAKMENQRRYNEQLSRDAKRMRDSFAPAK
ncbi:MAG: GYF domain-containing protein [Planctomycetota bacterium]